MLSKSNKDFLAEVSDLAQMHSDVAAEIFKNKREDRGNIALYHLSVIVKISLRVLCLKHQIGSSDEDSLDTLFAKAYRYVPYDIAELEVSIRHWHKNLPYRAKSVLTSVEGNAYGRKIQRFYNDYVMPYLCEIEEAEAARSTKNIAMF